MMRDGAGLVSGCKPWLYCDRHLARAGGLTH